MRPFITASLIASSMLISTAALAAPAKSDQDADSAARRSADSSSKVNAIYDFDADEVDGDALKPDHEPILGRTGQKHQSLIQLRTHFIPQMIQMANDV